MPIPDPKMTRIVLCESDTCSLRGEVRQPHVLSVGCEHPVTVQLLKRDEQ